MPLCQPDPFYAIAFCSRPEAAKDIISGSYARLTDLDKGVKFRDLRLNRSPEMRTEAVGGGIFKLSQMTTGSSW